MTTPTAHGSDRKWKPLAAVLVSSALAACLGTAGEGGESRSNAEGLSTITWVQTKSGGTGATSATLDLPQTAGDLNVVVIGWGDDTRTVTGVSDTRGNTYAVAAPMATGTGTISPPLRQVIYYAKNIAGGANTVSVTFSGPPYYPDLRVLEYGGIDTSAPFDVTASASGPGANATIASGSATTRAPNELIVGAGMTTYRFAGAGSSFTQRVITADGNIAEDRIVSTTASYSASATLDGTTQSWLMQMVTFKAGGSCVPETCAGLGFTCGTASDGCGGQLSCGTCTAPSTCGGAGQPNVCGGADAGSATTYLGCFKDSSTRDLPHLAYQNSTNTTENCILACQSAGYAYAGTQYSSQCFCGNSYGGQGTASNCTMACTGNSAEICGGSWANSVYKTSTGACVPKTCAGLGFNCGSASDGCGGQITCGTCTAPATCGGGGTPNVCGTSSSNQTYTTNFPLTENPISEGGKWTGGQVAGGNLWGNVQTTAGLAFGVSEPTSYGDPTALLTGTWGANQTARGVVRINSTPTGTCCNEIEVRLRGTIDPTAHTITGYEAYCSVMPNNPYCHIASWGGGNGVWVNMDSNSPGLYLKNGDVLTATATGSNPVTITAYVNGTQILQVQDTGNYTFTDGKKHGPWPGGNPGIGFYDNQDNDWSRFGWSSFTATSP